MGMLSLGEPYTQYCDINYSSASAYSRENEPHILLVLCHEYEGNDNISRGELLSILAAMVTQMEHDYLKSHCITPVSSTEYFICQLHYYCAISYLY